MVCEASTQILVLGNNNARPLFFISKLSFLQSMILLYHAIEVVWLASGQWIIIIINHHVNYQTFA